MVCTSNTQGLRTGVAALDIFGVAVTDVTIISTVGALFFVFLLHIILKKTKCGVHIRAICDNKELAGTSGIPVKKISLIIASLSAGVAAFAGILYGLDTSVDPLMGMPLFLSGVTASIIVNTQNTQRVYIGAIILATIQNMVVWFLGAEWKDTVVFSLLIVLLLVCPDGVLGKTSLRSV